MVGRLIYAAIMIYIGWWFLHSIAEPLLHAQHQRIVLWIFHVLLSVKIFLLCMWPNVVDHADIKE